MRTLTPSLLSSQKGNSRIPAVSVTAKNRLSGVVNLEWERLYTGTEPDYYHALTLPSDGSLIRLRITPVSDARKLYRQRVTSPGPGSDYSAWTYLNLYNAANCCACSLGSEVSLIWVKIDGEIDRQRSLDNGASWQSVDYPGYAPTGGVGGMAAAYKPNGDLALFFGDLSTLYLIKRVSGVWQSRTAWNKTTGNILGVAAIYADGDWKLLVSGKETDGTFKIWSLVYGDGGEVTAGTWSALKSIQAAPADGAYELLNVYLDKTAEGYRYFYNEKYSANEASNRPFWSHTLPGTSFLDNRWREPVPFTGGDACATGLAIAHTSTHYWLTNPSGVWRASLAESSLDLSSDILALKQSASPSEGKLEIELRNDRGQYSAIGQDALTLLNIGCEIEFSPGLRTSSGDEYSSGLAYFLEGFEHSSANGKASLTLYASDGWKLIEDWSARFQFRWNALTDEASVKEILTQVLARCGIKLEVVSQSSVITGFYPDFTIHPGESGKTAIDRLLSFVPDCLFIEGLKAYLVNPLSTDTATYSYFSQAGTPVLPCHMIFEGRYRSGNWKVNRIRAEGTGVTADSFAWDEIKKMGDRLETIEDLNIDTAARAHERGEAWLREAEIEAASGMIKVPVNCGQQLYDVIEITDQAAGLTEAKRRVLGITTSYSTNKGIYEQRLMIGGV